MTARRSRLSQPLVHARTMASGPAGAAAPDWAARALVAALFLAAVAVLSLPQARHASPAFGWVPLWLLGLPATAWLALRLARRRPDGR